jgi:hypothetical protein
MLLPFNPLTALLLMISFAPLHLLLMNENNEKRVKERKSL